MKLVKRSIFHILVTAAVLISALGSAVTVTPVYAISDTPLSNMPTANGQVKVVAPDGAGGMYISAAFSHS